MAFSTAQQLQELGVATPLAKELGVQIDANSFNWRRLMWASMPVQLAKYLADNLPNGTASNSKLAELGMIPAVIALITGGGAWTDITSEALFDAIDWQRPNGRYNFVDLLMRDKKIPLLGAGTQTKGSAKIINGVLIAGVWTNTSGNIWSTPGPATSPSNVFIVSSWTPEGVSRLVKTTGTQTAPVAGQWGHAASLIYIYSVVDPNTLHVEHVTATTSSDTVVQVQAANCEVSGLELFFSKWSGLEFSNGAASGSAARGNKVIGVCQDSIGGGSGATVPSNITVSNNVLWYAGFGPKDGTGGDGDIISFHITANGLERSKNIVIVENDIRYGTKSGIGNQSGVGVVAMRNYIEDCYDHIAYFPAPYSGGDAVEQTFAYNLIRRGAGERAGAMLGGTANNTHGLTVNLYNNDIYSTSNDASAPGVFVAGISTAGQFLTLRARNNIIMGWARGIQDAANVATLDLDYNCVFGNTTNYWDNSTGTLAPKAGPHSISSNPLFTNAANRDFTLQSGSPCINAGVDVGLTRDYAGNPVPVPIGSAPDIGAYERQAA